MSDRRRRWLLLGAALVVVVIGLGSEGLAHGTRIGFAAQRDLAVGLAIAGSGLVAWSWAPNSRTGPLLMLAGLTWFIGTLGAPSTEMGRLAGALTFVYAGVLVHAAFAWPTGRVSDAVARTLVVGTYIVVLFPPLWERDSTLLVVAALLFGGVLIRHQTLPPRARREQRPATLLGAALAAMLALKGVLAASLRDQGIAYPSDSLALWQITIVLVAVGLAWGLVSLERRRRSMTDLVVRLGDRGHSPSVADLADAAGLAEDVSTRRALELAERMSSRNAALRDELSAQVVALETSRRRLLEAEDDERAALEERLRRGATLRLARLASALAAVTATGDEIDSDAVDRLDRAQKQLQQALVELDQLARGLDPGLLSERRLAGALADLADRSAVPIELTIDIGEPQEPSIERALYYVASEALTNIVKHAHAAGVWLCLGIAADSVTLLVEDDGVGGADLRAGSGLRGLRDRLDVLGGTLEVGSRIGGGTSLRATIPRPAPLEG